jgi:hypothetical protein
VKAPRKSSLPARLPLKAARHVKSCVKSAQIQPGNFTPDMDKQVSATVGTNSNAPATRSQSAGPADPVIPYGAYGGYSPFGLTTGGTVY